MTQQELEGAVEHLAENLADCQMDLKKNLVVTLSGSTRFKEAYLLAFAELMKRGCVVLTVECFARADEVPLTAWQKERLDWVHRRKIDMSDVLVVLNVDNYIGESTAAGEAYAVRMNVPVFYLV